MTTIIQSVNAGSAIEAINVKRYGVNGNGVYLYDGAITSASTILTSASASFTSSDVGKVIKINGAGVGGLDLTTTITSFIGSTSVGISVAASTTVTGAFVAYGTDDTVAIQSAINAVFATPQKNGTLFFPVGIYIINGALQTSVSGENPNCQLYLPVLDNTVTSLPAIRFLGETPPFLANSRKVGTVVLNDGAILHSTLTSVSGTLPAMFGGCNTTVPLNAATFIRASFENIHVRVCSHSQVNGPVLTGINGARFQIMSCNDIVVDTDCVSHSSLCNIPTNEAAGVIYPQINTSNNVSSKNVYVSYFKYGVVHGELMTMLSAIAATCNYAFVFTNGNYSVLCAHLRVTHCPNAVLVASTGLFSAYDGASVFDVQQLDVEVGTSGGDWQDGVLGLTDIDNNGSGRIIHSYVDGSTHLPTAFTKSGGTGVVTQSAASGKLAIGSTSAGFIFDEANTRLGIGIVPATYAIEVSKSVTGASRIQITNTLNGAASQAQVVAINDGGLLTSMGVRSSGFTTNGLAVANQSTVVSNSTASFLIGTSAASDIIVCTGGTAAANERMRILSTGNVAISGSATAVLTAPTAYLHLAAGLAAAGKAPLKFTSGTNNSTAETGAMEYNGTNLFFTRTGTTRESVICSNAVNSVSPTSPNRTITVVIAGTTYYLHAKTTND